MNKGISPIIATLLLIFIATVAVVLIWFWLPSLRTESRGSVSVLLKIEAVSVSSNRLTLYIRNIGNEEIKIDKVSIDDPATGLSKYIVDVGPLTLKPGQLETVNVSLPTGIQAGKYALRVLSTSGISIATYVVEISSVSQQPLQLPLFSIVSYNSTILGAPSSSKRLVVGLVNDGGASGVAVVRVLDSSGNVASSASVSLSPGQRTDVSLSVVLPPASGNYQWRIIAINSATGNQDDERTVLVQVVTYTPVFYIASYTGNITGAVSSRQLFNVTVTNSGNATGTVRVRVLDQAGNTVNSTVLAVPPGASVATSLALTLPSSSGTYSWTVQAVDNATGTIHDSKPITVRAVVYQPKFSIQSYNTSITGAAGLKQKIVVAVANTGNATGAVQVNIIDNNGNTVNSTTLSIPADQTATATLTVILPSSRGTYTWKIQALNLNTTRVDDEKTFMVSVYGELIKNGDFSQGSAYWTLQSPWRIDTSLQLARINLTNPRDISASISQNFTVSSAVTLTQLKLYYYMDAHPPGHAISLQLVVSIESGSTILWSQTISWQKRNEPSEDTFTAQLSIRLAPGTYTLRIKALLNAGGNLNQVDIRVDNVSLLYAP
ncbi:archaellin/type IV pilin N-terminal domain-containing protein [Thermofilum adornatum]|uniref:archaellin/type IV pilin N-terminal domain-containing protein n=1 Tax=Thermofilum adornatum TaxID=1365176 RepID=UPI00069C2945|nr:archaellin/type IV pilin N-terminal domain-containing protein [Thermofilum adornatum]